MLVANGSPIARSKPHLYKRFPNSAKGSEALTATNKQTIPPVRIFPGTDSFPGFEDFGNDSNVSDLAYLPFNFPNFSRKASSDSNHSGHNLSAYGSGGYLSLHNYNPVGLSPAESFSTSDDSSPLISIESLPSTAQLDAPVRSRNVTPLLQPSSLSSEPGEMDSNANPNQVISMPYGSIQLATEEQRRLFGGLVASHNGLHSTGEELDVHGGDDGGGEEMYGESDEDEDGPATAWRKDSNATTGSSNQDSGLGSPKGKGKAFDAATTESINQAKKAFVKGQQDAKTGRRKINISFIEDDARRHITFSKRKAGIMKKAYELATLTGTQVLLLVVSSTGLVYTFSTPKLKPVVRDREGRELIQACLNAPDALAGGMVSDRTSTAGSTSGPHQARQASHNEAIASSRTPTLDSRPMSPDRSGPGSPPRGLKRRRTASLLDNQQVDDVAGGRLIARQRQQQQQQQQQQALQQHQQARSHTVANFSQSGKVVAGSHRMVHDDNDHSGNNHSGASDSSGGQNNSLGIQMSAEDARMLHTHAFINSLPHGNFIPNGPQPTAAPWMGALGGPQLLFEAPPGAKAQISFWNGNDVTNLVDTNDQVTQAWGRS